MPILTRQFSNNELRELEREQICKCLIHIQSLVISRSIMYTVRIRLDSKVCCVSHFAVYPIFSRIVPDMKENEEYPFLYSILVYIWNQFKLELSRTNNAIKGCYASSNSTHWRQNIPFLRGDNKLQFEELIELIEQDYAKETLLLRRKEIMMGHDRG